MDLTAHTSLSTIRRGFASGFVNNKKRCTRLAAASDKVYQLLVHGRWFSPGTPASSTTKTGRHDVAESGVKTSKIKSNQSVSQRLNILCITGADPGFQVRGAQLKKLRRAEGGANIFGVFRVKNHDFTPKNQFFSNCGGRREKFWVFRVKNHDFTPKNHIFSNFRGGRAPGAPPPLDPPLYNVQDLGVLCHNAVRLAMCAR